MAYNSTHTGAEVDAAVSSVQQNAATWSGKQNALTGEQGQFVGFNSTGQPEAQEVPAPDLSGKMNTVPSADVGNLPVFTSGGQLVDSGKAPTPSGIGAAAATHYHSASQITSGVFSVSQGGTGVSDLSGTDYTTYRVRAIGLSSSEPSAILNGYIVGVYE